MYSRFFELETSVENYLLNDDFSGALDVISAFVVSMMHEQLAPGELIGSKRLDALCARVGKRYAAHFRMDRIIQDSFRPDSESIAIVCTGLYRYGGTTLVIGDLIASHEDAACTVLASNSLNDMSEADLAMSRIEDTSAETIVAPQGDSATRLAWLIQQFIRLAPARIILLNHHQDSAIIAAAAVFVKATRVIFYHHADHNLCLGVHLEGSVHVDNHNVGYYNCRENEHVLDNAYLSMAVGDQVENRVGDVFMKKGALVTCSSATWHKFRNFYLYPYGELIIERLARRDGKHIHIGNISAVDLLDLRARLDKAGVDQSRFQHIPWVPRLWPAMLQHEVDLFIGSFPIGGARTLMEAMGCGLPILMSETYLSRFHSSRDIVYPGHMVWKFPSEFIQLIEAVGAEQLEDHSKRSRAHFERYYSRQNLRIKEELDRICGGKPGAEVPPLYPYEPDRLDRVLHFSALEREVRANAVAHGIKESVRRMSQRIQGQVHDLVRDAAEAETAP